MQLKANTYEQYLDLIASPDTSALMKEETRLIIERFNVSQKITSRFAPVTYILDYATRKYLFIEESCFNLLGYTAQYFLETGHKEYVSKWHPADFEVINNTIFPDNLSFLKTLLAEKYADYIFSYNHRILNSKDEYITVMQRSSYIPGHTTGIPAGVIGVVVDISHFKNDLNIVHTIEESIKYNDAFVNKIVFKKVHPVYETVVPPLMSKRELEVLIYMSEGLSSKQIAERLQLSIHTVNNHRKNMLHKTNCTSSAELLSHSVKHGLL